VHTTLHMQSLQCALSARCRPCSKKICLQFEAKRCTIETGRLAPADARELLFSRDGASLVDAAMAASPQGASGDPARQHLMLALLSSGAPAYGAFTAEPGERVS
jgi:hypothetical protein